MPLREDFIHFHMRRGLIADGWTLLAGEYPNGSDDELAPLSAMDPALARDRSPDHRRHSTNELVPDLVAIRDVTLLVVEAKPSFDLGDQAKLVTLRDVRRIDFDTALRPFLRRAGMNSDPSRYRFLPCLAMSEGSAFPPHPDFAYLFVSGSGLTQVLLPNEDESRPGN